MIKYYPQTRIKTDLYTRGTTYASADGKPYTGRYYLLYDGTAYAGANPVVGTNKPLKLLQRSADSSSTLGENPNITGNVIYSDYNIAKSSNTTLSSVSNLEELKPYYPTPSNNEYQIGYFTRYFAKNVTGPGYILEISKSDYASVKNGAYNNTAVLYETANLLWQLTGPLNDTRISQYQIQGGVFDTNKRVTEAKSLSFIGLVDYIGGEYTKFAKLTT